MDNVNKPQSASWKSLFTFTRKAHLAILIPGIVSAILCGAAQPAQSLLLGKAFGLFSRYKSGRLSGHDLVVQETTCVYYLLAVAFGSWIAHFIFFTAWLANGEVQARCANERLLASLLRKSQTWFDLQQDGIAAVLSRHQQ